MKAVSKVRRRRLLLLLLLLAWLGESSSGPATPATNVHALPLLWLLLGSLSLLRGSEAVPVLLHLLEKGLLLLLLKLRLELLMELLLWLDLLLLRVKLLLWLLLLLLLHVLRRVGNLLHVLERPRSGRASKAPLEPRRALHYRRRNKAAMPMPASLSRPHSRETAVRLRRPGSSTSTSTTTTAPTASPATRPRTAVGAKTAAAFSVVGAVALLSPSTPSTDAPTATNSGERGA